MDSATRGRDRVEPEPPSMRELARACMQHAPTRRNFHGWLETFRAAVEFMDKLNLLHIGFDVGFEGGEYGERKYTGDDRLTFYFEIADGWLQSSNFVAPGIGWQEEREYPAGRDKHGNRLMLRESEQLQLLAQKAYKMLAAHFFKKWAELFKSKGWENRDDESVLRRFLSSGAFLSVQHFFRKEANRTTVCNLSDQYRREPYEQQAIEFLLQLPDLVWGWEPEEVRTYETAEKQSATKHENRRMESVIANSKLWLIEVLHDLNGLGRLKKWFFDLDKACLTKLEKIAMRSKLTPYHENLVRADRQVATLEEACYVGSPAALLLMEYRLRMAEHTRLTAILQAQQGAEEANRTLAKLTGGKK